MNNLSKIKEYYGEVLKTQQDLQTSACCTAETMPRYLRLLLKNINSEISDKFYGCGSPIPHALEGLTVVDLGCGSGRDSYLLSQLVGQSGKVIGIDMTENQLKVAQENITNQMKIFGYNQPNIEFHKAYIEDLSQFIKDESVDLVISNCVINLSYDKEAVFSEIFRILKPGGELYFSDIFADRRIPEELYKHPELRGECLSGALYTEDFRRLLNNCKIPDFRTLNNRKIGINNPSLENLIGMVNFYSITVRAFKVELEDICEDYGHIATYLGSIPEAPHSFRLDDHHYFQKNQPVRICGNTANMLQNTRLARHFKIQGDFSTHFGAFDCSSTPESPATNSCC